MPGPDDRGPGGEPEQPLLPSYRRRPELDRALRANLRTLRDRCPDTDLRERFDAVISGRASLRELARSREYQDYLGPLVLDGARRWEEAGRPDDGMPVEPPAEAPADRPGRSGRDGRPGGPGGGVQPGGTW